MTSMVLICGAGEVKAKVARIHINAVCPYWQDWLLKQLVHVQSGGQGIDRRLCGTHIPTRSVPICSFLRPDLPIVAL